MLDNSWSGNGPKTEAWAPDIQRIPAWIPAWMVKTPKKTQVGSEVKMKSHHHCQVKKNPVKNLPGEKQRDSNTTHCEEHGVPSPSN